MQHKQFTPGDTAIPSSFLNDLVALLGRQERGRQPSFPSVPVGIVKVKNTSGADVPANAVLGVEDLLFPPNAAEGPFRRGMPAIVGVTPTVADHTGRFVITRQAIAQDSAGEAWASGVCAVKLNVSDESHSHADVANYDTSQLASAPSGVATILAKEAGLGTKWALIRIGGDSGTYENPHDLTYSDEHAEAARDDTYIDAESDEVLWSRLSPPVNTDGVKLTVMLGANYTPNGDRKLYAFVVDWILDSLGRTVKFKVERRVEIDTAEPC